MQQHVLFWDRDRDGEIYPLDTYTGFRDLGFNILFSLLATLIINLNFSYPTRLAHSIIPDPRFRVYVDSIYKAKHGSDSGTFDAEGRFVPQAFEDMFSKYDCDGDGALTFGELFEMMHGNRCAADPFGVCLLSSPALSNLRIRESLGANACPVGSCVLRMGLDVAAHPERREGVQGGSTGCI